MTRKISITEIPDVMEDAIVFLVAATTLEWTSRVKKATPVRVVYEGEPRGGGQLRNAWQTDIKPTTGTVTYPMQNLFVLEQTYQNHGANNIGQDKALLLDFQNLLEKNYKSGL
jgi:hypothetical protein